MSKIVKMIKSESSGRNSRSQTTFVPVVPYLNILELAKELRKIHGAEGVMVAILQKDGELQMTRSHLSDRIFREALCKMINMSFAKDGFEFSEDEEEYFD